MSRLPRLLAALALLALAAGLASAQDHKVEASRLGLTSSSLGRPIVPTPALRRVRSGSAHTAWRESWSGGVDERILGHRIRLVSELTLASNWRAASLESHGVDLTVLNTNSYATIDLFGLHEATLFRTGARADSSRPPSVYLYLGPHRLPTVAGDPGRIHVGASWSSRRLRWSWFVFSFSGHVGARAGFDIEAHKATGTTIRAGNEDRVRTIGYAVATAELTAGFSASFFGADLGGARARVLARVLGSDHADDRILGGDLRYGPDGRLRGQAGITLRPLHLEAEAHLHYADPLDWFRRKDHDWTWAWDAPSYERTLFDIR